MTMFFMNAKSVFLARALYYVFLLNFLSSLSLTSLLRPDFKVFLEVYCTFLSGLLYFFVGSYCTFYFKEV